MYISTGAIDNNGSDVFNRTTSIGDAVHGLNLGAALAISGAASGKFVVIPAGQVCDNNDSGCEGGSAGEWC